MVANFLYLAPGKPFVCSSQSALEKNKTSSGTHIGSSDRCIPSLEYASLPPGTDGIESALHSFCGHIQLNGLKLAEYYKRRILAMWSE